MDIQNTGYLSIEQLTDRFLSQGKTQKQTPSGAASFSEILNRAQLQNSSAQEIKFSKHAASRLADRGIELDDTQLERLAGGTRKAGQKGIEESLVLVDNLAFIVNVPSKTVVTAMDSTRTEESIFTNINGAVIA